jgi:hypothetical protein
LYFTCRTFVSSFSSEPFFFLQLNKKMSKKIRSELTISLRKCHQFIQYIKSTGRLFTTSKHSCSTSCDYWIHPSEIDNLNDNMSVSSIIRKNSYFCKESGNVHECGYTVCSNLVKTQDCVTCTVTGIRFERDVMFNKYKDDQIGDTDPEFVDKKRNRLQMSEEDKKMERDEKKIKIDLKKREKRSTIHNRIIESTLYGLTKGNPPTQQDINWYIDAVRQSWNLFTFKLKSDSHHREDGNEFTKIGGSENERIFYFCCFVLFYVSKWGLNICHTTVKPNSSVHTKLIPYDKVNRTLFDNFKSWRYRQIESNLRRCILLHVSRHTDVNTQRKVDVITNCIDTIANLF